MPHDRRDVGCTVVVKNPVRAHQRRLRVVFQRALLLALAPPAALQACSDDTVVSSSGVDAGDATIARDVAASDQTSADSGVGTGDAGEASTPSDGSATRDGDATTDADVLEASDEGDEPNDASVEAAEAEAGGPSPWCSDASAGAPWWPDASGNCRYFVDLSCAQYVPVGGCLLSATDCMKLCSLNTPLFDCEYAQPACTIAGRFVAEAGQPVDVQCDLCPGAGRRPEGLRVRGRRRVGDPLGEYFARAAYLEAASVHAFDRLERELRAHRAPACLASAARRSSADEVGHAAAMRRVAARYGVQVERPPVAPSRVRSLERIARENAVEGCIRETYGALLATWQAMHATDARIRRCFARIAADETRHAALAWAVAEWAESRLDAPARARVARARRHAVRRLSREIAREPRRELAGCLGLPSTRRAAAMVQVLEGSLTSPRSASVGHTSRHLPRKRTRRAAPYRE
jgi:hypothetical protein